MSAIKEMDWLDISDDQKSRVVAELKDWHQTQVQDLVKVIRGQHEGAISDWWDAFCLEDDSHHEVSNGPTETVEQFAERLIRFGWGVENLGRFQLLCSACINREPELSEEEERMDALVYMAHKGD